MKPPEWFWYVLSSCLVIATVALSYSFIRPQATEWQWKGAHVFNPQTAMRCSGPHDGSWICVDMLTGELSSLAAPNPPLSSVNRYLMLANKDSVIAAHKEWLRDRGSARWPK